MEYKRKTILLVEDSPVQALSVMHLLERPELSVLWASDGCVGVTMAKKHQPDLIILDIEMPEMNGIEVCRQLKQNVTTREIPIIMLTVRAEPENVFQSMGFGAVDFIPKDVFSGSVLLETLRQLDILTDSQIAESGHVNEIG